VGLWATGHVSDTSRTRVQKIGGGRIGERCDCELDHDAGSTGYRPKTRSATAHELDLQINLSGRNARINPR
jgi:hypothetical protein